MASKDAWGAAFCCGTSSVVRISALESCGGFPTDSVTEDFLLTLQLNRNGWRTVYLNEPLSNGPRTGGHERIRNSAWTLVPRSDVNQYVHRLSLF